MRGYSLPQADKPLNLQASQAIGLLRDQRGTSLIEVLVITFVLVAMITTIYIGAVYAEKQIRQNYRHRAATLIASGELERQWVYYLKMNTLRPYLGDEVVIDRSEDSVVSGRLSVTRGSEVEFNVTKQYPYYYVVAEVSWIDPDTRKNHKVKVREDFYEVEGKVND